MVKDVDLAAEQLYQRIGWTEMERLAMGDRNVVVMKKDLLNDNEQCG